MADYIRPTPRSPILGLLADALTGGVEWMRDPRRAQQMQGLGGLLAETGIPTVVERLSYGEPLTTGRGMTTRLRPEAEAALMTLGPEAVPIGRGAMAAVRATKGLPVGASIRKAGKEINVGVNEAGNFLSAKSEFGQVGGLIRQPDSISDKPYLRINYAEVEESQRGKGHGKGLYEALIKEANERGLRVFSDYTVEKPAVNVYKSLGRSGYDITDMSAGTLDDGSVYGIGANRPAFEIRPKSTSTISAPQNAALRLAQQRAALPVSEGGLGLPAGNTPMDRARAMGFTTPAYRGTTANEIAGKERTFVSENPDIANQYAGYLSQFADDPKMLDAMMKLTPNGNVMPLLVRDAAMARARTNVPDYEMILDANQARSRFAAFDPTRRNEPDLLAGALPFTALLDEENRTMLEEQLGGLLGR